jgi:polyisoprenyl-phosphate glycosyltransferase
MSLRVAAIVPAYNEELTIVQVVTPLLRSSMVNEVMVISDGSTDHTAELARQTGASVYEIPHRQGKGEAMLHALSRTDAEVLVFFDADLRGLTSVHVEALLKPVLDGSRMMNVGLRDQGRFLTKMTWFLPLLSGQRALLRSVIEELPPRYVKGFMIEASLNYLCRSRGFSYGAVELKGLSIRRKYEKIGWPRAVLQYMKMSYQVAAAMVIVRMAHVRGKF